MLMSIQNIQPGDLQVFQTYCILYLTFCQKVINTDYYYFVNLNSFNLKLKITTSSVSHIYRDFYLKIS